MASEAALVAVVTVSTVTTPIRSAGVNPNTAGAYVHTLSKGRCRRGGSQCAHHSKRSSFPTELRKAMLASIVAKASPGIRFSEHMEGDGPTVFAHACKLGLDGIVSKRKDSGYRSGRSPDWLKIKNSDAPAVKREAEEEWGKKSGR